MNWGREMPGCWQKGGRPLPGGKQDRAGESAACRVCTRHHGVVIPWLALGENIPLPGGHLEEGGLPFPDQKAHRVPLSSPSTAGDRGVHRGQLTWL